MDTVTDLTHPPVKGELIRIADARGLPDYRFGRVVVGDWAVVEFYGEWSVTHVPTGARAATFGTVAGADDCCWRLAEIATPQGCAFAAIDWPAEVLGACSAAVEAAKDAWPDKERVFPLAQLGEPVPE